MKIFKIIIVFIVFNLSANAQSPLLSFEEFQTGFTSPTTITNAGDDRLFILEQNGIIKFIQSGNVSTFMDINDKVSSPIDNLNVFDDELGLLGLAFHPDFENNGFFFVNYTNNDQNTIISRFKVNPNNPNEGEINSEEIILEIDQPFSNHNGGCIAFGPDGFLYIGMGDGGNGGDPQGYGQNMNSLLGKILRIDVTTLPYSIPNSNPFVGNNNYAPEIWASGVRNPWKFSFDKNTGDLWIGDVGQNAWEEVDFQPSNSQGGENYGWNCYEGFEIFQTNDCNDNYTDPIHTYENNGYPNDCSITGGHVYRGSAYPNFDGHYIFGDYCTGKIFTLFNEGGDNFEITTQENTNIFISCFGEDSNGELYLADRNTGIVYSIIDNSSNVELNKPESVDFDQASNRYFISNSNNGEIIEMGCDENKSIFRSNVGYGPHGLEVVGNQLFACSGSFLKAYDLESSDETLSININSEFANGITHKGDDVYITDFSNSTIIRYNTSTGSFNTFISDLPSAPNGIFYDQINDRLLVVSWGEDAPIYEINIADSSYTTIETNLDYCDGISMDNNGDFYVSNWGNNTVVKFNSDFSEDPTVVVNNLFNPADIYYNTTSNILAIPNSGNNTVVFENFAPNVSFNCSNNQCVDPGDGTGSYATLGCCQEACSGTSEIDDNLNEKDIFPNPISGGQTLNFSETNKLEIYNLDGRLLYYSEKNAITSITIPSLKTGLYILKIDNKMTKLLIE